MTKEQATSLINELQEEVSIDKVRQQFWMDKVQGYVQFIFGDNTQSIALPMFGTYYGDRPYNRWTDMEATVIVEKLRDLFKTYLEMINKGVFFRKNIASDYTNPEIITAIFLGLIALLCTIGAGGYSIGYSIGEGRMECKIYNCELENKKDRDSISLLSARLKQDDQKQQDDAKVAPISDTAKHQ